MSQAVLYTFGGSVWAAVAELAVIELGYEESIEKKTINLVEGANFSPEFLAVNPKATLPTLKTSDGKVYTSTDEVVDYLVRSKNAKSSDKKFINEIHEDKYDPNFALLLARNEEELKAKAASLPGLFVQNRQNALEKFSATPEASPYEAFYREKTAGNGGLLALYKSQVPESAKSDFFQKSSDHWASIQNFIKGELDSHLPTNGFVAGDAPGEEDFHIGAWLARIAATTGASKSEEGLEKLAAGLGFPVPSNIAQYWNAWSARHSWKKVYEGGLH